MVVNVECMAGGGDGRLAERGDGRLLFLLQQVIHLIWCHDNLHLDLPAIHAQDPFHFSRVMTLAQKICTLVGALVVMPPYFLCSFILHYHFFYNIMTSNCSSAHSPVHQHRYHTYRM